MRAILLACFAAALLAACGPSTSHECSACGDNSCVDTSTDTQNCGECGGTCPGDQVCITGSCQVMPTETCTPGDERECYDGASGTSGVGVCHGGSQTCGDNGYWGACLGETTPTPEQCSDGVDNDCNGMVDDEHDSDGDGWSNCAGDCCDTTNEGCDRPDRVNPGAFDAPGNDLDDDCDGVVDNGATATCDSGLMSNSPSAMDFAKAMDLCATASPTDRKWGVISAKFVKADDTGAPLPQQTAIRPDFGATSVQLGASMVVLSTGNAATPSQQNPAYSTFQSTDHGTTSGFPADFLAANNNTLPNAPGCPAPSSDGANDPVMLELKVRVPTNAQSFSLKTNFMSAEFPEWVCTEYNDFFVVLLDSQWHGDPANPADKNLAFYVDGQNQHYPVGVNLASGNTGLFQVCKNGTIGCDGDNQSTISTCTSNAELTNTGMDQQDIGCSGLNFNDQTGGGTGWLATSGNVSPGEEITLRIALWDTSDGAYDSVAMIDGFTWSLDPASPGTIIVN